MKVYLVCPRFERNIWSFDGLEQFTGMRYLATPLGLATVAALTPKHWTVEIADENVESIDFETDADLIGMGPFTVQFDRSLEIAAEFRRRGKPVVFGGPYCTLAPEVFEGKADYLVCGEAELNWAQFLVDFERGEAARYYPSSTQKANLQLSPVPRYDLVRGHRYLTYQLQTGRGCPFQCEFCDIIVTDGRVPRLKTVEHVLAEVDHCVKLGARYINFGDANIIGNIPYAKQLLSALAEYSRTNNYPVEFACEATINLAQYPELLKLCQAARMVNIFVGVESPRRESLIETKKQQNTRHDIVDDIARINGYNIAVTAGMIVGFDADDLQIFEEQYQFLQRLATPFTTCGTLVALPNTALEKRMQREGRLLETDFTRVTGHGANDTNFVPLQMTRDELSEGYNWLLRSLYRYDSFGQRLSTMLNRFRPCKDVPAPVDRVLALILIKVLGYYTLTFDFARIRFFVATAWRVARGGLFPRAKWVEFFKWMAIYPSLRNFVTKHFGVPEEQDPTRAPFKHERIASHQPRVSVAHRA